MAKKNERVFIRGARLSFPALDEPREAMAGQGDPKYQATFLLEPSNESIPLIQEALMSVARSMWGDRAAQVLQNPEKNPLKSGDAKERIPEGYAGMLYIAARSKNPPELRDANPHILITDQRTIREKFVAGYKVNGFIDLYSYEVKNPQGVTIKSGIAASLVSVQFAGYADAFSGVAKPAESEYPDCSAEAEASSAAAYSGYGAPAAAPAPAPAPVNTGYPQPVNNGYPQPVNNGYPQPVNSGYPQPVNNGYPQPPQSAPWSQTARAAEPPMADDGLPF
jgi:hypothetical protein